MAITVSHTTNGQPLPLGSSLTAKGVNFAIFSRHATEVSLLLFEDASSDEPAYEFVLDPDKNRTGNIWHVHLEGLDIDTVTYMYRMDGPKGYLDGHLFNKDNMLLDPYARRIAGTYVWDMFKGPLPKAHIVRDDFDWQNDKPLNYPLHECIIYEVHLKGLTQLASVDHPGTYLGVIEAIPYLKKLGITSVEFLPVFEFDELEYGHTNPFTNETVKNYWGYSTLSFFTPKWRYSATGDALTEFKTMVRELHKNDIEVILDVVFNHTVEGNENGPLISFKGLDNTVYYTLYDDKRYYWNYSGCGNTVNCNHPVVIKFILDCLHYWVIEMHVDGFRFDLASILCRDGRGHLLEHPHLILAIAEDPVLYSTKMIAEPWDAGGAYQVGSFPSGVFAEWNDRYRDDVRRFWKNDSGMANALATRISGSSDLYAHDGRKPYHSINYVTAHDGFTLNDLVSYNFKHNEANGNQNRDGSDNNQSYNGGVEGETTITEVQNFRIRQIKNFMLTLTLSQGVPMFLGGDEFRRTQLGNNNAYCQDNEISWFNWEFVEKNATILRFFKEIIAFRRQHNIFKRTEFYTGQSHGGSQFPDIIWYSADGNQRNWHTGDNCLSCRISGESQATGAGADDSDIAFFFNPAADDVSFVLPPGRKNMLWFLKADTSQHAPFDIYEGSQYKILDNQKSYLAKAHSAVVLISGPAEQVSQINN